jgi:hypothetical protein
MQKLKKVVMLSMPQSGMLSRCRVVCPAGVVEVGGCGLAVEG